MSRIVIDLFIVLYFPYRKQMFKQGTYANILERILFVHFISMNS